MRPIFIGDELSAAGYRLAGVEVRPTPPEEALAAVRAAMSERPPLVLVASSFVHQWRHEQLVEILGAVRPPVLPVSDASGAPAGLDLVEWIRGRIIA